MPDLPADGTPATPEPGTPRPAAPDPAATAPAPAAQPATPEPGSSAHDAPTPGAPEPATPEPAAETAGPDAPTSGAPEPATLEPAAAPAAETAAPEPTDVPATGQPAVAVPAAQSWTVTPQPEPERRLGWRRILLLVGVIGGLALCAVIVMIVVGLNIGLEAFLIGLAAAVIPVPIIVGTFLWLDRFDPEPWKYLVLAFAWGATFAPGISLAVNTGASLLFERLHITESAVAVFVAPFIEEITKALGPLMLFWFRRKEISGVIDGIVYCGMSATGFAMVENILYLGGLGYAQGSAEGGAVGGVASLIGVFIARVGLSGFAHPLFTAMTGIGIGVAARSADKRIRWLAPIGGLVAAMILHGSWNLMPSLGPNVFLYGYPAVMVPLFFIVIGVVLYVRSFEGRVVTRTLPDYVRAAWFSPPEVAALATARRRMWARRWAKRVAGDDGRKAMRSYQFAATKLAVLRDGLRLGIADNQYAADEKRLLTSIVNHRRVFTGHDPAVPAAWWQGRTYRVKFPDGNVHELAPAANLMMPLPAIPLPPPPGYPIPPNYPPRP